MHLVRVCHDVTMRIFLVRLTVGCLVFPVPRIELALTLGKAL